MHGTSGSPVFRINPVTGAYKLIGINSLVIPSSLLYPHATAGWYAADIIHWLDFLQPFLKKGRV